MPDFIFTEEGPQYYKAAYERNKDYATGGPYFTKLKPKDERKFRRWLKSQGNPWNFDADAPITDYDLRGYWKEVASQGKNESAVNPVDDRLHLPDTYKTPYDTTFSGESKYAKAGVPLKWEENPERLVNTKTGDTQFQAVPKGENIPSPQDEALRSPFDLSAVLKALLSRTSKHWL